MEFAYERDDAAWLVGHLQGVRGVTYYIQVTGPTIEADRLHRVIEAALTRRTGREVRRTQIGVQVEVDRLTGAVRSRVEKRAVLGAA